MNFSADNLYHVYNQGNNKQLIFNCDEDYLIFLRITKKLIKPNAEIVAYCLMPNHFHFMIFTKECSVKIIETGLIEMTVLSNSFGKLLSGYTRIVNKNYGRSGSLFRQKTKAKLLSQNLIITNNKSDIPDYPVDCFRYIHNNPVKAGLVQYPEEWQYSSYLDYVGLRNGTLCNKEIAYKYNLSL